MFGNILGKDKNKSGNKELVHKILKMNIPEMRSYVNNRAFNLELTEEGLVEVLKKLTSLNEESEKRYIQIDDMDSKIKKGFDLVITISQSQKISVEAVELIQEFIAVYQEIIEKFDRENKQIYASKLNDALSGAIKGVNRRSQAEHKLNVLNT